MDEQIDPSKIAGLPPQQVEALRQSTEQEIDGLQFNHALLSRAQSEFRAGINAMSDMAGAETGTDILLPLTDSLYIPAKISNPDKLLVDIGTGFIVERTPQQASEFCQRKIDMISDNLDTVSEMIRVKSKNAKMLDYILQQKIEQMQRAQKP